MINHIGSNPFNTLGATPHDKKERLSELAEDLLLLRPDSEEIDEARKTLQNPIKRLKYELRWFPGAVDKMGEIREIINIVSMGYSSAIITHENFAPITALNMHIYSLYERPMVSIDSETLGVISICRLFGELNLNSVLNSINEDRIIAGLPKIPDLTHIKSEIKEYQDEIRVTLTERISTLKQKDYSAIANKLADEYSAVGGALRGNVILNGILSDYETRTAAQIDKIKLEIISLAYKLKKSQSKEIVVRYSSLVQEFDAIAKPIRLTARENVKEHKPSVEISKSILELVDVFRRRYDAEAALALVKNIKAVFSDDKIYSERLKNEEKQLIAASLRVEIGSTNGNLENLGLVALQGNVVYFSNYGDNKYLYSMNADGSDKKRLLSDPCARINVVNGWIYYVSLYGLKLKKYKIGGSSSTAICNDKIKYNLIAVNDTIYYVNNSDNNQIYAVNTSGSFRKKISNDVCGSLNYLDGYLFYRNESDGGKVYKIRPDGSGRQKINDDNSGFVIVEKDWVFYMNRSDGDKLYAMRKDGTLRRKIADDNCADINAITIGRELWVFYINYSDGRKIYKVNYRGLYRQRISNIKSRSINIAGEWVYFLNIENEKERLYKVRLDGTAQQIADVDLFSVVNGNAIQYKGGVDFNEIIVPCFIGNTRVLSVTGSKSFANSKIDSVVIENGVRTIDSSVFRACYSLRKIELPNSLHSIHSWAFARCSSLTHIALPTKISRISDYIFYFCSSLHSVQILSTTIDVGEKAFSYCKSLHNLRLPCKTLRIEEYAFSGSGIEGINSASAIVLPQSLHWLGKYAFSYCHNIQEVIIPENISYIREGVFIGCDSLRMVKLHNGVYRIGPKAFQGCWELDSIFLPKSVTNIGKDVFSNTADGFTIHCQRGSYAELYAKTNGINLSYRE